MKPSKTSAFRSKLILATAVGIFLLVFIVSESFQITFLSFLFPKENQFLHSRLSLLKMSLDHLKLAGIASILSILTGFILGVFVTRGAGKDFLPLAENLNALIQTLPPSAVIILAFPFLGFGWEPTLLALFLYSLFPVVSNTIVGLSTIPPGIVETARGLGMKNLQRFFWVEFPMAYRVILTGARHAFILNVGTAAIGAVIGAGGLGTIIISGLVLRNSALIFSGALVTSGMAILGDLTFSLFENPQEETMK